MNNTNKIKHLEMIENIIERMAKNCFQLKAWTMTLVVLIGGLAAKDTERKFIIIAFIPIIVFWLLDTYYLRLERQYRILYKTVTEKRDDEIDFSMDLSQIQNMSISDSKNDLSFKLLFVNDRNRLLFTYYGNIRCNYLHIKYFWLRRIMNGS